MHENQGPELSAEQHRRWVANFTTQKVKEFLHYLRTIVAACDRSVADFRQRKDAVEEHGQAVTYAFSGLVNAVQTLKDSASTAAGQRISWSQIHACRHGAFISAARNAATHDGNPVVDAWSDGKFFVASQILRLDDKGKRVSADAPDMDVRAFCLEFAEDFCELLRTHLEVAATSTELQGPVVDEWVLHWVRTSSVVPADVKAIVERESDSLLESIRGSSWNPLVGTIAALEDGKAYCGMAIQNGIPTVRPGASSLQEGN